MVDREATDGDVAKFDFTLSGYFKLTITPGDNIGTAGQVLTSAGPGFQPDWEDAILPAGSAGNFQRFNASGTWNKPSGYDPDSRVLVRAWGGGGSGGRGNDASGGGGGGFIELWTVLSQLASSVSVTVGAGGAGRLTNGDGSDGGNSTFGGVTGYGGGGGDGTGVGAKVGGGGGGLQSAGAVTGIPGLPWISNGTTRHGEGTSAGNGSHSLYHGGGGGGGGAASNGGNSTWGGAGGAGHNNSAVGSAGSSLYGGHGGAAQVNGANAGAGSQPGGGGGAAEGTGSETSGAGGDGRVEVFIFPAS